MKQIALTHGFASVSIHIYIARHMYTYAVQIGPSTLSICL